MPLFLVSVTMAKSLCGPPAAGSIIMKRRCFHSMSGGFMVMTASMSSVRKHCCNASKASPESSDWMRSGRSAMTTLSRSCLVLLCHRGTRWSMCLHSAAFPSFLHFSQARVTCSCLKVGRLETGSRHLKSLV